ncbi:MAG: hypothetical protein ACOZBL_04650 [Patescibacteria group bacterium]
MEKDAIGQIQQQQTEFLKVRVFRNIGRTLEEDECFDLIKIENSSIFKTIFDMQKIHL